MNCDEVLDFLYYPENRFTFIKRILIYFHLLRCPKCAAHKRALRIASLCAREDFLPPAENLSENIMALVRECGNSAEIHSKPETVSFRAWIISGLAILVSLSSAYFGVDYLTPANTHTIYFMLPLGITVGAIITAFGAIFIGCHIPELSKWLGLNSSK